MKVCFHAIEKALLVFEQDPRFRQSDVNLLKDNSELSYLLVLQLDRESGNERGGVFSESYSEIFSKCNLVRRLQTVHFDRDN